MRRLIVVTQQVDPGHPALAATVPMLRALAARVDELVVLADVSVPESLPANCRVRSYRAGSRPGRGLRFGRALAAELARGRPLAVLAHMCPIYAVLAAPLARPLRVPVLLWFTHPRASRLLRLAERASTAVLSVDAASFPLASPKLRAIGHGIDVDATPCVEPAPGAALRALALGRYSAVKGYAELVRGLAQARDEGVDVRLRVYGPTLTPAEREHRAELGRLVAELDAPVELREAVPYAEVPALLAGADVLVSNTVPGSADKAVLEACAACRPALVSTPVFAALLPQDLRFSGAAELADRLGALARLDPAGRAALGRSLRAAVEERHSVESWADGVLAAAEGR